MSTVTCTRAAEGGPCCGAPATTHFKVHRNGLEVFSACPEHEAIARTWAHDEHPIGPGCKPGRTIWAPRKPPGQSFCIDEDGDNTIHRSVRQPARVHEPAHS